MPGKTTDVLIDVPCSLGLGATHGRQDQRPRRDSNLNQRDRITSRVPDLDGDLIDGFRQVVALHADRKIGTRRADPYLQQPVALKTQPAQGDDSLFTRVARSTVRCPRGLDGLSKRGEITLPHRVQNAP